MRIVSLLAVIATAFTAACATHAPAGGGSAPSANANQADPDRVYERDEVTREPRLANRHAIGAAISREYPSSLAQLAIRSTVRVSIVIDEQGGVRSVEIVERSPHPEFDQATINVIRQMRFRPGRIGSTAVAVCVELPIQWTLQR
jgi:TonB family protein